MQKTIEVSLASYFGENTCCSMGGVKCYGSKVTEINWKRKLLTGPIPPDISKLLNLEKLYKYQRCLMYRKISENQLTGPIFEYIGNLVKLQEL
jgi:hypothetical protein